MCDTQCQHVNGVIISKVFSLYGHIDVQSVKIWKSIDVFLSLSGAKEMSVLIL